MKCWVTPTIRIGLGRAGNHQASSRTRDFGSVGADISEHSSQGDFSFLCSRYKVSSMSLIILKHRHHTCCNKGIQRQALWPLSGSERRPSQEKAPSRQEERRTVEQHTGRSLSRFMLSPSIAGRRRFGIFSSETTGPVRETDHLQVGEQKVDHEYGNLVGKHDQYIGRKDMCLGNL